MDRLDTVSVAVIFAIGRVPFEIELITAEQRPIASVRAIADDIDKVKFHQGGDVLCIANVGLVISVGNRDSFICRVFELKDRHWDAIDEQNDIRTAVVVFLKFKLVDRAEHVNYFRILAKIKEVNKLICPVIPMERIATGQNFVGFLHGAVQRLIGVAGYVGDQGMQLILRKKAILPAEILLKVIQQDNIILLSVDVIAALVLPAAVL